MRVRMWSLRCFSPDWCQWSRSPVETMHPESGRARGHRRGAEGRTHGHGIVNVTLNATKGTVCWTSPASPESASRRPRISTRAVRKAGAVVVPFGPLQTKGCTRAVKALIGRSSRTRTPTTSTCTRRSTCAPIRGQLVAGMVHM